MGEDSQRSDNYGRKKKTGTPFENETMGPPSSHHTSVE